MINKKIISLLICTSIACTAFGGVAFAKNTKDSGDISFSINANKNSTVMDRVFTKLQKSKFPTAFQNNNSGDSISFKIKNNGKVQLEQKGNQLDITGEMLYNNTKYQFSISGDFFIGKTLNNNTGIFGTATGYMNNKKVDENHLNLTIQYVPETSKVYVFASIGVANENSSPNFVIFGEPVEEVTPIINKLTPANQTIDSSTANQITTDSTPTTSAKTSLGTIQPALVGPASDYNRQWLGSMGSFSYANGTKYQLSAVSFFAPKRMVAGQVSDIYTKINSSYANAKSFIRNYLFLYGTTVVWCNNAYLTQGSSGDPDLQVYNIDPQAQNNPFINFSWYLPYNKAGIFSTCLMTVWAPNIITSLSRYSGSTRDNTAQWTFNSVPSNMDWQNGDCASTQGGVSGHALMTYLTHRSYSYNFNIVGKGQLTYNFQDQYGGQVTSGTFTTTNPGITYTVAVDPN